MNLEELLRHGKLDARAQKILGELIQRETRDLISIPLEDIDFGKFKTPEACEFTKPRGTIEIDWDEENGRVAELPHDFLYKLSIDVYSDGTCDSFQTLLQKGTCKMAPIVDFITSVIGVTAEAVESEYHEGMAGFHWYQGSGEGHNILERSCAQYSILTWYLQNRT